MLGSNGALFFPTSSHIHPVMYTLSIFLLALLNQHPDTNQSPSKLLADTTRAVVTDSSAVFMKQDRPSIFSYPFDSIATSTRKTAENTTPTRLTQTDHDEIGNLVLAFIAAIGTLLTAYVIWRESKQQEINRDFQFLIMKDLIRHLYRNKIVLRATTLKLQEVGFDAYYPSEEHLLKLKVFPEDLRITRFSSTSTHYDKLLEFELKFRNFNIEVDVALNHLKQPDISQKIKERDLDVLEFKSGYLTKEILKLMGILGFDFNEARLRIFLKETSNLFSESKLNRIKKNSPKRKPNKRWMSIWILFLIPLIRIALIMRICTSVGT